MKTVRVKAAALADKALVGKARVPKEGTMRRFITEHDIVEVQLTQYYLRKINAGDLEIVSEEKKKEKASKKKGDEQWPI